MPMSESSIDSIMQARLSKVLKRVPLFCSLSDHAICQLSQKMDTRFMQSGYVIFEKGDPPDCMYIIQSGKVLIYTPDIHHEIKEKIAVLIENDFFGEMGLVGQKPRNASARTLEDSIFFVLTRADFYHLLNVNGEIATEIMNIYMQRTKNNQRREFLRTQNAKQQPKWEEILTAMIDQDPKFH